MQASTEDQRFFHEQTDSFDLTVAWNHEKLAVHLKDFKQQILYFNQYTKDYVGGEIHPKMDLLDIFSGFSQSQSDEENMKNKSKKASKLLKYEFGQVIEFQNIPCYKIEKEGKITVYQIVVDKKTKIQTAYESKLILFKVRNLFETDQVVECSEIEKRRICEEFNKQIERFQKEKESYLIKIAQLEKKNAMLEKENEAHERPSQSSVCEMEDQLEGLKLKPKKRSCKTILLNLFKRQKPLLMGLPQVYRERFKIKGNVVEYIGAKGQSTQFIFNHLIHGKVTTFKLKILELKGKALIGITNYGLNKDKRSSCIERSYYNEDDSSCYTSKGTKYPNQNYQGNGFKQGDTIRVEIDKSNAIVKYIVNGKLSATQKNIRLGSWWISFMPFVQLQYENDAVEWLSEQKRK